MADKGSLEDIKQRIQANPGERSGRRATGLVLKSIGFSVPRLTRAGVTEHIAKRIADGELTESALESALIGFEEASDMRIYLLQMDHNEAKAAMKSLLTGLQQYSYPC